VDAANGEARGAAMENSRWSSSGRRAIEPSLGAQTKAEPGWNRVNTKIFEAAAILTV
jgi:hypothetical protein